MTNASPQPHQLIFHDRTPGRLPGYSAVYSGEIMGSVELDGATLYRDSTGPKVLPAAGADIGSTALYAAYVAIEEGVDVRVKYQSPHGSRMVVVSGEQPTREEVKAIPPDMQRDIYSLLRTVRGIGHLSRRQKLAIGVRAKAVANQCLSDDSFSEVA